MTVEAPIEIHAVRRFDIAVAVVALPLAALGLVTGAFWLTQEPFPIAAIAIPALLFGLGFASLGLGALWRVVDRRPVLAADASGVRFHPAYLGGLTSWVDIGPITVEGQRPARLVFVLHRRIWAVEAPLGARRVRIALSGVGLGRRRARRLIMEFSRLRGAAIKAGPSYPDLDAGD